MRSHLNDAAEELTGKLEKPFVSERRMAAVSNTVQSTVQLSTRAYLAPAGNMQETDNKAPRTNTMHRSSRMSLNTVRGEEWQNLLHVNNRIS